MRTEHFKLVPFNREAAIADLQINGRIDPHPHGLAVHYILKGELHRLQVPAPVGTPRRKDGLWQFTCFECFIRRQGAAGYREFNFSPSGDWNAYRFTDYRQAMAAETAVKRMPMAIRQEPTQLDLTATIDLASLDLDRAPLQLALSAVTRTQAGRCHYWALLHPADKPDFHHQTSFRISL